MEPKSTQSVTCTIINYLNNLCESSQIFVFENKLNIIQYHYYFYNICRQNTRDPHQEVFFIPFVISISFLIPSLFFNIRPILWNRECCTQKSRRGTFI